MVRNIGHKKLIEHLGSLPTVLSGRIQQIFADELDLFGLYELLKDYPDDHLLMMGISRPYLRLAIERGADLRQKNTSGNSAIIIALMYDATQNSEMIKQWLRKHPE